MVVIFSVKIVLCLEKWSGCFRTNRTGDYAPEGELTGEAEGLGGRVNTCLPLGALGVISSFSLSPAWKNEALLKVVGILVTCTNSSDSVSRHVPVAFLVVEWEEAISSTL